MEHGQVVVGSLFVSRGYPAQLFQPVDGPLHQVAQPVQCFIERPSAPLIHFPGDGVTNAPPTEIGADLPAAVPLVATDPLRPYPGMAPPISLYPPQSHQLFEYPGLMLLTPGSARRPLACPSLPPAGEPWCQSPLGSGLEPGPRPPPFGSSGVLMRSDDGPIDIVDFPLQLPNTISLLLKPS